ncbi:MAG: hypothetical protein K9H84_04710 [Bacteroidales bacterium]|nr:hypothetical protein [Bacteroidales bacterium]
MIDVQHIEDLVNKKLSGTEFYLFDCSVSSDNRITVILDGDSNVSIEQCMAVNRYLENALDRSIEDFELQVTSYGADMPLTSIRQLQKYLNRPVDMLTDESIHIEGNLLGINENSIEVEPIIQPKQKGQKPKKGDPVVYQLSTIKEIKPVMKF